MAITLKQYNHEKDSITIGFMPQYKYCSRAGVQGMGEVLFIRVSKRITPKLYKLKDGEMYILFSFPPFLFDSDEGMMEIKGNKGIFYKKPAL